MDEPGWSPDNNESTNNGNKKSSTSTRCGAKRSSGRRPSVQKSVMAFTKECPLAYRFTPHFKDTNPAGGREYMCVPINSAFHAFFESYVDFTGNKETVNEILLGEGRKEQMPGTLRPRRQTLGAQLFLVKLKKGVETIWNAIDDNGSIEMVHLVTGRICQGYYDMGIQHSDPPRTKRGFIVFQLFVLSDEAI